MKVGELLDLVLGINYHKCILLIMTKTDMCSMFGNIHEGIGCDDDVVDTPASSLINDSLELGVLVMYSAITTPKSTPTMNAPTLASSSEPTMVNCRVLLSVTASVATVVDVVVGRLLVVELASAVVVVVDSIFVVELITSSNEATV